MLRNYFPTTNAGAEIYGGFMLDKDHFCRIFPMEESFKATIAPINQFLDENDYEKAHLEEFDETYSYKEFPVSISKSPLQEEFVLTIERDIAAVSETEFITRQLLKFRDDRDWEQFHNPKDLAIAINIEAGELLEQFLWKDADEAELEKVKEELADVLAYSLLLAEKFDLSTEQIVMDKIKRNREKYPVGKSKGTATKYTDL